MPQATSSPSLFLTSTSEQQAMMKQGFIDRMMYKMLFKPLELSSFHNISEYVIRKVLCQPTIHLNCNNFIYINQSVANQSVSQIMRKMAQNVSKKGQQNYIDNDKLMRTLRVAIRDSRNLNKVSRYQQKEGEVNKKGNLWYFK